MFFNFYPPYTFSLYFKKIKKILVKLTPKSYYFMLNYSFLGFEVMRLGYLILGLIFILGSLFVTFIGALMMMGSGAAPTEKMFASTSSEVSAPATMAPPATRAPTMAARYPEPQPALLWKVEVPKYVNDVATSSGGEYVAVSASDSKTLYLLTDGGILWEAETDAYLNSVAVSSDGTYVSAGGKTLSLKGEVYLFEDGKLLWKAELDTETIDIDISEDFVGVATKESLYLFDIKGNRLWTKDINANAITMADDLIAVLLKDSIEFFNVSGELVSSHPQTIRAMGIDATGDGGFVFAHGQYIYRNDASGNELWKYRRPTVEGVVINDVSMSIDGKYVLGVSNFADESYLIGERGSRVWIYNTGKYVALSDGGVYATVASGKNVYLLDGSKYVVPQDSDSDGIPDYMDSCPNESENKNEYQDDDGCPDALPLTILAVNSEPAEAKVFIDQEYIGKTPLVSGVTQGSHSVVVRKAGYDDWSKEISSGLEEWSEITATLEAQYATLSLESDPSKSQVFVDDSYIGNSPITTEILATSHKIRVKLEGYEEWSEMVLFSEGDVKDISADLVPLPGSLLVSSNPQGANIYVDGVYKGITYGKTQVKDLSPGSHKVELVMNDYRKWTSSVVIKPGGEEVINANLKKSIFSLFKSLLGYLGALTPLLMFLLGAFFMKKGIFEREIRQTFIEVEETVGDTTKKKRIPVFVSKGLPTKCPQCSSPFSGQAGDACEYCGSIIEEERHFKKVE